MQNDEFDDASAQQQQAKSKPSLKKLMRAFERAASADNLNPEIRRRIDAQIASGLSSYKQKIGLEHAAASGGHADNNNHEPSLDDLFQDFLNSQGDDDDAFRAFRKRLHKDVFSLNDAEKRHDIVHGYVAALMDAAHVYGAYRLYYNYYTTFERFDLLSQDERLQMMSMAVAQGREHLVHMLHEHEQSYYKDTFATWQECIKEEISPIVEKTAVDMAESLYSGESIASSWRYTKRWALVGFSDKDKERYVDIVADRLKSGVDRQRLASFITAPLFSYIFGDIRDYAAAHLPHVQAAISYGAGDEFEGDAPSLDDVTPIIRGGNEFYMSQDTARLVRRVSLSRRADLAAEEAARLRPVWDGLERLDKAGRIADISDYYANKSDEHDVGPNGRGDKPFRAREIEDFYNDLSAYLSVFQSQKPVLYPIGLNGRGVESMLEDGGAVYEGLTPSTGDRILPAIHSHHDYKQTNFGFWTFSKREQSANGTADGYASICLTKIGIDNEIMGLTHEYEGDQALISFQNMMEKINHDYFHFFTGRELNVYLFPDTVVDDEKRWARGRAALQDTPWAALNGSRIRNVSAGFEHDGLRPKHGYVGETSTLLNYDIYARMPDRHKKYGPRGSNQYEMHALQLHSKLYMDDLHSGAFGQSLLQDVADMKDAVTHMMGRMIDDGRSDEASMAGAYYAILAMSHLIRMAPPEHDLITQSARMFDELPIKQDYLETIYKSRGGWLHDMKTADDISGADDVRDGGLRLADEKLSHKQFADFTVGDHVKWHGLVLGGVDLNSMYEPRQEAGRDIALSTMRKVYSHMARDISLMKYRGGLAAYQHIQKHKSKPPAPA